MLFLLDAPLALVGVALALLIGTVAHGVVQTVVAERLGDRQPRAAGRASLDPRKHFEAFGVVAMVVSGIGWGRAVPFTEPRFRGGRGRHLAAVAAGPLTNLVLAALGVFALRVVDRSLPVGDLGLSGQSAAVIAAEFALVNAALAVLTSIPLPPLDGARVLWAYAPRTAGWRRARYLLEEQNLGVGICLALTLPLFGGTGLITRIVLEVSGQVIQGMSRLIGVST